MNARTFANNALRHLHLPVPQRSGKTLNVFVDDKRALPDFRIHCACPLVANYVWRAAHEQGCDKIRVHASSTHKHEFDTIDFLKKFTVNRLGFVPKPFAVSNGKTPAQLATAGHRALGNEFDRLRGYVSVPQPISSDASLVESTNG